MMNERIIDFAKEFGNLPNVPFLYGNIFKKILTMLNGLGVKHIKNHQNLHNGNYYYDDYCLYVKFKRGNPRISYIIDTHIDHPGFVINNKGFGIAFGSIGIRRLEKLLESSAPALDIYDNHGGYVSTKKIVKFHYSDKPYIFLEDNLGIPNNSHGVWQLPSFSEDDSFIYMKNADNMIATSVALAIIENIVINPEYFNDIDVTFIFGFLEEVFEISATHVALRKATPFGKITPETIIIVLESMQSVPLQMDEIILQNQIEGGNLKNLRLSDDYTFYSPELREEITRKGFVNRIYSDYGIEKPNHDDGLLVKINDTDCVYGTHFPYQDNKAEEIIVQVVESENIKHQHTVSGGACNGTAYSLFPTTSNIVTFNIPNQYKHNIGIQGEIVNERVKKQDVQNMYDSLCMAINIQDFLGSSRGLSKMLKSSNLSYDLSVLKRLQIERSNITWGARKRLSLGKYFSDNLSEEIIFKSKGLIARIREKFKLI